MLLAVEEMGFQLFLTPSRDALEAYRRQQRGKKEASEQKKDKDKKIRCRREGQEQGEEGRNDEEEATVEREGRPWHRGRDHPEILSQVYVMPLPARHRCLQHRRLRSN